MNANNREFIGEIKRCDEMLRRLRYFRSQMISSNLETKHDPELKQYSFTDVEAELEEYEKTIRDDTSKIETIKRHENELIEIKHVIELGSTLREEIPNLDDASDLSADYRPINSDPQSVRLNTVTGVIPFDKIELLHRMCFVMSRGNIIIKTAPLPQKTLSVDTVSSHPILLPASFILF